MTAPPTLVETALRHQRAVFAALVFVTILSWAWIVAMARDMYGAMTGPSAWMMTPVWEGRHILLLWAMWTVMMAAMMLPAAAPLLLLYGQSARARSETSGAARVYAMAGGYLLVWGLFSVAATALQRLLAREFVLTPMMEPATPLAGAAVLAVAGVYQLTPLKRVCLQSCRSPLAFLMRRWRTGTAGAFRMGVEHGLYCLGCCWALMLLLFAGGVMNLAVILALTAWVIIEKLAPFGEQSARVTGVLLLGAAAWTLAR